MSAVNTISIIPEAISKYTNIVSIKFELLTENKIILSLIEQTAVLLVNTEINKEKEQHNRCCRENSIGFIILFHIHKII